jgi:hypothetical integral membrane protein (TIGR02206 family)
MFRYYFTYLPDIPKGIGFGQFSLTHFIMLAIMFCIGYFVTVKYASVQGKARLRIRRVIAVVLWSLEFFKDGYLAFTGQFDPSLLPLHLCGMGMMVLALDAVKPARWTRSVLYSFTVWGAGAALLFPDWAAYPILNQWALQSFLIHTLLVTYPVMLMVSGEMVPNWRELKYSLEFLVTALPIAAWANGVLGTNFWFLSIAAPGSPLQPIQEAFGSLYLPVVFVLLCCLWFIMYAPWAWVSKRRKRVVAVNLHL